jgi:hypothetical protein
VKWLAGSKNSGQKADHQAQSLSEVKKISTRRSPGKEDAMEIQIWSLKPNSPIGSLPVFCTGLSGNRDRN